MWFPWLFLAQVDAPPPPQPILDPEQAAVRLALQRRDRQPLAGVPLSIFIDDSPVDPIQGTTGLDGTFTFVVDAGTRLLTLEADPMQAPPELRGAAPLCRVREDWACQPHPSPLMRDRFPYLVSNETVDWEVFAEEAGTAQGVVLGPDGRPFPGARVMIWQPSCLTPETLSGARNHELQHTFSDHDGRFTLYGRYDNAKLAATAPGFVPAATARLRLEPGTRLAEIELPLAQARRIQLHVRHELGLSCGRFLILAQTTPELERPHYVSTGGLVYQDGPLAVAVEATGDPVWSGTLDGLISGSWTIEIHSWPATRPAFTEWRGVLDAAQPHHEIVLAEGRPWSGRIRRNEEQGLSRARVHFFSDVHQTLAFTDDHGRFRLEHLPTGGTGRLHVEASDGAQWDSGPLQLSAELPAMDFMLPPAPRAALSGRVLEQTSRPLRSGSVHLRPASGAAVLQRECRLDHRGRFVFAKLEPGDYQLEVRTWANGDLPRARVSVAAGADEVEILLSQGVEQLANLTGYVHDAHTGAALRDYQVRLIGPGGIGSTTRESRDTFLRLGLDPGPWHSFVTAPGYAAWEQAFSVEDSAPLSFAIPLLPVRSARIEIHDRAGRAAPAARVHATWPDGRSFQLAPHAWSAPSLEVRSNARGQADVLLPPAALDLTVEARDGTTWTQRVEATEPGAVVRLRPPE